jgi:hypothetical protein
MCRCFEKYAMADQNPDTVPEADDAGSDDSVEDSYILDGFVVRDSDAIEASAADADTGAVVDGLSASNIVTGKRRRRSTRFIYDEPEFSEAMCSTLLSDVPAEEYDAVLADDCDDCEIMTDDDNDAESEAAGAGAGAGAGATGPALAEPADTGTHYDSDYDPEKEEDDVVSESGSDSTLSDDEVGDD